MVSQTIFYCAVIFEVDKYIKDAFFIHTIDSYRDRCAHAPDHAAP